MTGTSRAPDIAALHIPMDMWTWPFWEGAAEGVLHFPACADCGRFRWPPGPFCPACRSQAVAWIAPAGAARIYSYTIVPDCSGDTPGFTAPGLIEFDGIDHVRLLASIVGAPAADIRIGAALRVDWVQAENARVPVFRLA